jgi:hypothetical protein
VRARGPKIAQLLVRQEIKNFCLGACFTFSTVAQTIPGTEHRELLFNREVLPSRRWGTRTEHVGQPPSAVKTTGYRPQPPDNWELLSHHEGTACPRGGGGGHGDGRPQTNADEHGLLLRTRRWFPHTSTSHPQTCAQGRFRGVDATHVPAARPASQQRRVHLRRSAEAVHGPNPFCRRPIGGFLRKGSDSGLRLPDFGLIRWCPVSSGSGHV